MPNLIEYVFAKMFMLWYVHMKFNWHLGELNAFNFTLHRKHVNGENCKYIKH